MAVGLKGSDSETLDTSPGGLFTNPHNVSVLDLNTVEGHLEDAINAARASKGWAVGDDSLPLSGYGPDNNSEHYSEQAQASAVAAAGSATSAAASATSAAADAIAANQAATRANDSATNAAQSATDAAASAAAALVSENAAAQSAIDAAASETEAARQAGLAITAAAAAAEDSDLIAAELARAEALAAEVRQLQQEVAADSEELHALEIRVRMDSEQIARDVARAEVIFAEIDSEAQLAEAYAVGTGRFAGEGAALDSETDGRDVYTATDLFGEGSTDYVEVNFPRVDANGYESNNIIVNGGTRNVPNVTEAFANNNVITIFHNYVNIGNPSQSQFYQTVANTYAGLNQTFFSTVPIPGDIIHVFVTTPGQIPTYESAWFQAERAFYFQDEARRFDSDARARDSEINSLVSGANARIDSEKVVRRLADEALGARIDSEDAALDAFQRRLDSDLRIIHERVTDAFDVGYGLELIHTANDTDIVVDTDVIASRRYVDSEIAGLIGASPGIYTTLTRIREALDSDETVLDSLVAYMDSDRIAREELADQVREDIDSDARAIEEVGRRIDSEQAGLNMRIDSDNAALDLLRRRLDSDLAVIHSRVTDAFDVGYGLEIIHNANDTDIVVDTDVIASRRYVDSEIRAQERADSDIHTRIDSEIIALRSRDSELFARLEARLDSEGGSVTTFRSLTDTPTSYDSEAGDFVRVNSAETRLEFFNPFPVVSNQLTTLNGLRIRSFDNTNGAIIFATFTPTGSLRINPTDSLNWDQAITGFTMNASNPDDFPDEFINRVFSLTVGGTTLDVSGLSTDSTRNASFTRTLTNNFLDPRTGAYNGGQGPSITASSVLRSNNDAELTVSDGFRWNAAGWSSSGSSTGTIRIDARESTFNVTGRVNGTSDFSNITSVSTSTNAGSAGSASRSGNNYTSTITDTNNLYHDTTVTGTWTGTFTRPTNVSAESAANRAVTLTTNWTRNYTANYPVWSVLSANATPTAAILGTLSNSGYAETADRVSTNQAAWRGQRYTFDNSGGTNSMTGFIVAPQAIGFAVSDANFTNPDVQNAVYSGVTRTTLNIGHSGHQATYYFYGFTVGAGATVRVDVSS